MTLTDFHKQAYTAGAQQALVDFGVAKTAEEEAVSHDDVMDTFVPSHMLSRGAVGGGLGALLGGVVAHRALRDNEGGASWGQLGKGSLAGLMAGLLAGQISGAHKGNQARNQYARYVDERKGYGREEALARFEARLLEDSPTLASTVGRRAGGWGVVGGLMGGLGSLALQPSAQKPDWEEAARTALMGGGAGALFGGATGALRHPFRANDYKADARTMLHDYPVIADEVEGVNK